MLRRRLAVALVAVALLGTGPAHAADDGLQTRVLGELDRFIDWLHQYNVKGYVGEVGWPDGYLGEAAEWNALAEGWFDRADAGGLWVTVWATGEWWGDYKLGIYESDPHYGPVNTANAQAGVLESHLGRRRGVSVAGGEFGIYDPIPSTNPDFSNKEPGTYDTDYHYDSQATFNYLASRGVRLVRIPFRWERIQAEPGGSLRRSEVDLLRGVIQRAGKAGLEVVLDMHNYGGYYRDQNGVGVRCTVGSSGCTVAQFADVWRRIAKRLGGYPVIGYGIMNEPVALKKVGNTSPRREWQSASRAAVRAIRGLGDRTIVLVPGYNWSSLREWTTWNPRPWVEDARVVYEAHHYWDSDHSGRYELSYADEVAAAE